MDDKITIIEGPPPTFAAVHDSWLLGLHEGMQVGNVVVTQLRTFNGPELVERCHRSWRNRQPINLEFRNADGLQQQAPIVAARYVETEEGHLLILWIRVSNDEVQLELGYEDDLGDIDDEDPDRPDWSL